MFGKRLSQLFFTFFFLSIWSSPLFALTIYSRQEAATNPRLHSFNRFGYLQRPQYLPGPKAEKPCVSHGLARCMYRPTKPVAKIRYTNRLAEQNKVHPLLRTRYKYKTVQNF